MPCSVRLAPFVLILACAPAAPVEIHSDSDAALTASAAADLKVRASFRALLGREVDPTGLTAFSAFLLGGGALGEMCATIVGSAEFQANRAGLSSDRKARDLYRGILERDADPAGLALTIAEIDAGRIADRATRMFESLEFVDRFLEGVDPIPLAGNDAVELTTVELPTQMACGATATGRLTVKNTGTATWIPGTHRLGTADGSAFNFAPGNPNRLFLPDGTRVAPGGSHTFSFNLTAPNTAGSHPLRLQMVHELFAWFGPLAERSVTVACAEADAAELVSVTLPSTLSCGGTATGSVTYKNTGTAAWTTDYRLGALPESGVFFSGYPWRILMPSGTTVAPGQSTTFSFSITAPNTPGTVSTRFGMVHELVRWFGPEVVRPITVSCAAPTDGVEILATNLPSAIACGRSASASLTVRNTGTTTWTADAFRLGTLPDSAFTFTPGNPNRLFLAEGTSVSPGATHVFAFALQAPVSEGTLRPRLQMVHELVRWFGPIVEPAIAVSCAAATPSPLHVEGNRFVNAEGEVVHLAGAIICCEDAKANGWPWVSSAALQQMAAHRANFTHVRNGPNTPESEGAEFVAYANVGNNRVDLDRWDDGYWARLRALIEEAGRLGIYVEVDLIDAWVLERPELSAWGAGNNINGVSAGDCDIMAHPPEAVHERWLRKMAAEVGRYDNVLFEIGNETFDCGGSVSAAWEVGVATIVRDELQRRGYGPKLIGTNSHRAHLENDGAIDYIERHDETAQDPGDKPIMVNEYGHNFTAAGFDAALRGAYERGTMFHLWRNDMSAGTYEAALGRLEQFMIDIGQ